MVGSVKPVTTVFSVYVCEYTVISFVYLLASHDTYLVRNGEKQRLHKKLKRKI